ncbi:MAG: aldehyde dehydrogenase family protein [Mariprofundaceae bacterium]
MSDLKQAEARHYPLMVPGASASGMLAVHAPFDGSHIADAETIDASGAETALATAYALYRDRSGWLPISERVSILEKTASIMRRQAEDLALLAAREGGKPLADSRIEVARAIDGMYLCVEAIRHENGEVTPMRINAASSNRMAMTQKEPIGVVVAVSAFNHPLNLIVHQAGPAVAAGCPVIIKPAGDTPLSCLRFVQILLQAGLPEAWCQVAIVDDQGVAEQLATDARVGFFSFIGSSRVGWMLRSRLAPGVRCSLEHGGAAPVIVAADADLDDALPLLAKGGFYHAGQVCVSVQRVFAHASIAESLAKRLADIAANLSVGDPLDEATEVGPLIRKAEVERVENWVSEAERAGAELLTGGKPVSDSCFAPTVLYGPPDHVSVSRREIFGPVVSIYPFEDIDDAITRANSLDLAFQAAVFTRNIDTAMHAYRYIDASAVMINDHTAFRVDWMPFAGLKHSGLGVGGIARTLRDMQIDKLMVLRSAAL